jgi:hypothetical protein
MQKLIERKNARKEAKGNRLKTKKLTVFILVHHITPQ